MFIIKSVGSFMSDCYKLSLSQSIQSVFLFCLFVIRIWVGMIEEVLYSAVNAGDVRIVKRILTLPNLSIDLNWGDEEWGRTAFYRACYLGFIDIVKLLMEDERVDVNQTQNEGASPLLIACQENHIEIVKLLLNDPRVLVNRAALNGVSPFLISCDRGYLELVKLLFQDQRIDVNEKMADQATPFLIACEKGRVDVVRFLLSCKNVDINSPEESNSTPLYQAVVNGHLDVVKWLLASEREVDITITRNGRTALDEAKISKTLPKRNSENEEKMLIRRRNCQEIEKILTSFQNDKIQTQFQLRKELGILGKQKIN